jgi:hypothetical protein
MKGVKLKKAIIKAIITGVSLSMILSAGCAPTVKGKFLTVDFQEGQTLRYKFVTSRNTELDWGQAKKGPRTVQSKSSESMELIVSYTPLEIDPYGLTTIKATCEKVKVRRKGVGGLGKDAVESLAGKTFNFTVRPTGKIEDYSELTKLLKETGKKALRAGSKRGKIKDPDMIDDFIATQWFLWDAVSSIEKPFEGIEEGQSWQSIISVPNPLVLRLARNVVYTLEAFRQTETGNVAVIKSSYSPAGPVPRSWPVPYTERFQVAGTFGTFRNYRVLKLEGQGEELYNIDRGLTEKYNQSYRMEVAASFMMPLKGLNPAITINQNISMQLIED